MKTQLAVHPLAAALLVAFAALTPIVRASVPAGPPVFTTPLSITNPYLPFQPGGIKVFSGNTGTAKALTVFDYLTDTRTFTLGGKTVECRILREMSFENNQLIEISFNHFAQADDGSVYYFGEVVNIYENGVIVNHEGSWLVGGPGVSDPPETTTATAPGLIMPGTPELGDMFKPEDLFPVVDETGTVVATGKTLRVPTGLYTNVIKIKETSQLPGGKEAKFYAPGVGELQAQARDELQRLIATTFAQP